MRNPRVADIVGRKFPALASVPAGSDARVVNPIDGRADFIAVAPVRNTPLRLAVTRDAEVALRPWRDETIRVAMRTLIVMLLGALLLASAAIACSIKRRCANSEERYALAMEGANEGHWDWDMPADRLFLSPRMKVLDGQERGRRRRLGKRMDAARIADARLRTGLGSRPRCGTTSRASPRVSSANIGCATPTANGTGCCRAADARSMRRDRPSRFVGSAIDITEQKQAQVEKERLETQLRQSQKMEAVGTLAGGIAHDFNNVLGAIIGYGELALQHSAGDNELRRYLDNVMHAAERAKLLVARILGFSRSGLGDQVLVNVQSVVGETLDLLEGSLPADIRLETKFAAGDAAVLGDPTYLHQVTMNLCTNAVQSMKRGGVLGVGVERLQSSGTRTPPPGFAGAGRLCAPHGQRHRRGNPTGGARTDIRSLLYDQGSR